MGTYCLELGAKVHQAATNEVARLTQIAIWAKRQDHDKVIVHGLKEQCHTIEGDDGFAHLAREAVDAGLALGFRASGP